MSIRAYVDEEEVLKKPAGPLEVHITTGWANEHVVDLSFRVRGEERLVRIGGNDLERMINVLARDPRYENLFHPDFVAQQKPNRLPR